MRIRESPGSIYIGMVVWSELMGEKGVVSVVKKNMFKVTFISGVTSTWKNADTSGVEIVE